MDLRPLPPLSLIADDCKRSSHELMLAFHAGIMNVADFEGKEPNMENFMIPNAKENLYRNLEGSYYTMKTK